MTEMTTEKEINDFKNKIRDCYRGNRKFFIDGIIHLETFTNSESTKYKLLWVLKEPFDKQEDEGEFDYCAYISGFEFKKPFSTSSKLWKNIIHTSYCILNDFQPWNDIDNYDENEEVFDALDSIALINLKKIPGTTRSNSTDISNHYNNFSKKLITEQIELINPDIIICGGTFDILFPNFYSNRLTEYNYASGYKIDDIKVIRTYHPSAIVGEQDYCDNIINCIKYLFH